MTQVKTFNGLPFFIGTGTKVSTERDLALVQSALYRRLRNVQEWYTRYRKGREIRDAINNKEQGVIKNVNMTYAYNAYFKFLHQSLLSLRDSFRLTSSNYKDDLDRPTEVLKGYLDALQSQNDLLIDDAIKYGCATLVLDVNMETGTPLPDILLNRVKSAKIVYDYEQPGPGIFTIRVTPELAFSYTFLSDYRRMELFNHATADAEAVAEIRVFIGDLVVNNKLDNYLIIVFRRQVIYAEKGRDLTTIRSISINDKNDDCSPIYPVLTASELSRDVYKILFDYSDKNVNPIRTGPYSLDAKAFKEAEITKYLKLPSTYTSQLGALLPGQLDVNGLISIQTSTQLLSQQATGLNEYTLGESGGSVRTLGEAMMLADSASGILNILSNKIKQQLILPALSDILEIMKFALKGISDIFPESLQIDVDIAKDQQESNVLLSLINMPMFGAVIQGLQPVQALMLFRWILEKLHISGINSVFDDMITNTINSNNNNNQ